MGSSTDDPVKAPAHYAGDGEVDCRRAARSMVFGWAGWLKVATAHRSVPQLARDLMMLVWMFQAFRYIWRAPLKNGVEDLRKAVRCIEYAINEWECE